MSKSIETKAAEYVQTFPDDVLQEIARGKINLRKLVWAEIASRQGHAANVSPAAQGEAAARADNRQHLSGAPYHIRLRASGRGQAWNDGNVRYKWD